MALLFYAQALPPLVAITGAGLVISGVFGPASRDRADMIAIGVLAFAAGMVGTALVLYVRMLVRRLRSPESGPKH